MLKSISLTPEYGENVVLKVNSEIKPYTVEEILAVKTRVFEDRVYELFLDADEQIDEADIYVNGEKVNAVTWANRVTIQKERENQGTFGGQLGFIQIAVHYYTADGKAQWYYSDFVSIMVRSSNKNRALDSMLKYIYENQEEVLKTRQTTINTGKDMEKSYEDFWSQIMLLEDIANVYETCYGYFMTNSRQKLEKVEVVDRVEKLQFIDSKTIGYIVRHPEYLKNEITGIKSGKGYYLPSKTLMLQNKMTPDIYENQVVLSFLAKVFNDTEKLKHTIAEYLKVLNIGEKEENGYIVSSYLLFVNAQETIKEFAERTSVIAEKLEYLFTAYQRIINVKLIDCSTQPRPTALFLSVPQYNMIYLCLSKWFNNSGYEFIREKVMMSFINAPAVYEAYVLIKLVNQIKSLGFNLVDKKNIEYQRKDNWFYQNKEYSNTYVFEKDEQIITLYYEPVIYDEPSEEISGLSIYRNNTVSLNMDTDDERKGHYYVPDYVLKAEFNGIEHYVICDAKFTYLNRVRNKHVPELSYKYIFSISSAKENADIVGMNIFYGITDENEGSKSFYDKQQQKIYPFAEMIPLSENVTTERQESNFMGIMRELLKR